MVKAVLFDMDGVIIDTEPLHKKAYFSMFDEVGIKVPEELYSSFTGMATLPICKRLCEEFQLNFEPQQLVQIKRDHFKGLFQTDTSLQLIPGVLALIQDYVSNGLVLVVASSASMENINRVFDRFGLNTYFKAKVSGADLEQSKPHPEIFEKAALLAEVPKEYCMVIEDATNGIKAAKSAGIYCVAYRSQHSTLQNYSLADKVIDSYAEIAFARL